MVKKVTKLLILTFLLGISSLVFAQVETSKTTDSLNQKSDLDAPDVIVISDSDLENETESQEISSLLTASKDVFISTAGYTFSSARFKIRGYQSAYTNVFINGVNVDDRESGGAFWSNWGGLNDATRNQEIFSGINIANFGFGSIGGATNINMRASSYRKTIKATYSLANRNYRNRLMVIASTGETKKGFSAAAMFSKRWAKEGYVEGTFYDSYAYFVTLEQRINKKHSLGFVAFGSPTRRGKAGMITEEAAMLSGSEYYNPYWGYQNGEKRNASISNYHQPRFILSWYFDINEKSKLQVNAAYLFGRGGSTALNWAYGNDPRPDYYRNMPSYYDPSDPDYDYYYQGWTTDEDFRQLNWDYFYMANSTKLQTVTHSGGVYDENTGTVIGGETVTGKFSKYIVEERRTDVSQIDFSATYNNVFTDQIKFTAGADASYYTGDNFKVVNDLLGGDYFLDVDKFAEGEEADEILYYQNDLYNINNVVRKGDIFGYRYLSQVNKHNAFAQADFNFSKVDFYVGARLSNTIFWRDGMMKKGTFPNDSYGKSAESKFLDYAVKTGITYKINGRNYFDFNLMNMTMAPTFRSSFLSVRSRNTLVSDLRSQDISGFDVSYKLRHPRVKGNISYYLTDFSHGTWSRSFYHEDLNNFVNYQMTGVGQLHQGVELGVEGEIVTGLTATAVGTWNNFMYNSKANATISIDNDASVISDREVYLQG
ncbi:MAG: TonB-dependent receptor plug domain-containing protein [Bacteroidales bacterium]|nr:TonB-dependent receptor plug domain-containing protein [Bacteroidales bacterium]